MERRRLEVNVTADTPSLSTTQQDLETAYKENQTLEREIQCAKENQCRLLKAIENVAETNKDLKTSLTISFNQFSRAIEETKQLKLENEAIIRKLEEKLEPDEILDVMGMVKKYFPAIAVFITISVVSHISYHEMFVKNAFQPNKSAEPALQPGHNIIDHAPQPAVYSLKKVDRNAAGGHQTPEPRHPSYPSLPREKDNNVNPQSSTPTRPP